MLWSKLPHYMCSSNYFWLLVRRTCITAQMHKHLLTWICGNFYDYPIWLLFFCLSALSCFQNEGFGISNGPSLPQDDVVLSQWKWGDMLKFIRNPLGSSTCGRMDWSNIDMIIPLSEEVKAQIRTVTKGKWQELLNEEGNGWYLHIQNQVGGERGNFKNRREDTIVTRLRLGLAALNYSLYRMNKHKSRNCIIYGPAANVEHVLIYCTAYERERPYVLEEFREMGIVSYTWNIAA